MQFWESNNLPQIPMIISVLEEKEYRKYNEKGQLGKTGFPLAYKLSLLESNQHDILPISLPHFHLLSPEVEIELVISNFTNVT